MDTKKPYSIPGFEVELLDAPILMLSGVGSGSGKSEQWPSLGPSTD